MNSHPPIILGPHRPDYEEEQMNPISTQINDFATTGCLRRFVLMGVMGLAGACFSAATIAEQSQADEGDSPPSPSNEATPEEVIEMTPAMRAAADAHQQCVNTIMSTQEKATEKRQRIKQECAEAEQILVLTFPEEMQQLVQVNTARQIENVLASLEEIESAVVESAEDTAEIAEELAALEAEQQAQALAEVEAQAGAEAQARLDQPPPEGPQDSSDEGQAVEGAGSDG